MQRWRAVQCAAHALHARLALRTPTPLYPCICMRATHHSNIALPTCAAFIRAIVQCNT